MQLPAVPQPRRANGEFPRLNQSSVPSKRPEEIRFADVAVIEPIFGAGLESVCIESPTAKGNRYAELMFLISLAVDRSECQTLTLAQFSQWAGSRRDWRRLVIVTIESMKDPIQAGNFEGNAEARFHGVFHDIASEVRLTNAGDKREPGRNLEFVTDESFLKARGYRSVGGRNIGSTVCEYITEEIVLVLGKAVYSGLNVILPKGCVERSL